MSVQANIEISFSESQRPKEVLMGLLKNGWTESFGGDVMYLLPKDFDEFDWTISESADFSLTDFMEKFSEEDKIGIVLVFGEGVGGEFLISKWSVSFSPSINRVLLKERIPDFSWYLKRIMPALSGINVSAIQCESVG